eukprot:COSAG01_NODE_16213_length_1259_cov_1.439655_2_plen_130_part_01
MPTVVQQATQLISELGHEDAHTATSPASTATNQDTETLLDTPRARVAKWRWTRWREGKATLKDVTQALHEVLQATGQAAEHARACRNKGAQAEQARIRLLKALCDLSDTEANILITPMETEEDNAQSDGG